MKNLDISVGKAVVKFLAFKVDVQNALNILGLISDDKLEKLNEKAATKAVKIAETLNERYKNRASNGALFFYVRRRPYGR